MLFNTASKTYSFWPLAVRFPGGSNGKESAWIQSLGLEDPLEKGMATYSSILAWRIPWTEESGGLQYWSCNKSDRTE